MATQDERRQAQAAQAAQAAAQQTAQQAAQARQAAQTATAAQTAPAAQQTAGTAAPSGIGTTQTAQAAQTAQTAAGTVPQAAQTAALQGAAASSGTAGTASGTGTAGTGYAAQAAAQNAQLDSLANEARRTTQAGQIAHTDTAPFQSYLDQWRQNAVRQSEGQVDNAVRQGTRELTRTQAEAEEQYLTQMGQIHAEEARARDNQALYNAAAGNTGGIGSAQMDQIAAAAMTNRNNLTNARNKAAREIRQQIADLRAQGQFQKADAALEIGNQYLIALKELEQWVKQYNLSVDQFNAELNQRLLNYLAQVQAQKIETDRWTQEMAYNRERAAVSDSQWDRQMAYQQSRDAVADQRYNQEYADSRADLNWNRAYQQGRDAVADQRYNQEYADSRADLNWNRAYQQGRDAVADQRYNQEYADSRADVNWNRAYQQGRDAVSDARYNQEYADSRADVNWNRAYQQGRDTVSDARYNQEYADSRADMNWNRAYQQSRDAVSDAVTQRQLANSEDQTAWQRQQAELDRAETAVQAAASQAQAARNRLATTGQALLNAGVSIANSPDMLDALGMTADQAELYRSAAQQGLVSSSGTGTTQSMTRATAESMARNGQWTDTVYNALLRGGYTAQDIQVRYGDTDAFKSYMAQRGGDAGMNESRFRQAMQGIVAQISQGGEQTALNTLDALWDQMNESQRQQAQSALSRHGLAYQP